MDLGLRNVLLLNFHFILSDYWLTDIANVELSFRNLFHSLPLKLKLGLIVFQYLSIIRWRWYPILNMILSILIQLLPTINLLLFLYFYLNANHDSIVVVFTIVITIIVVTFFIVFDFIVLILALSTMTAFAVTFIALLFYIWTNCFKLLITWCHLICVINRVVEALIIRLPLLLFIIFILQGSHHLIKVFLLYLGQIRGRLMLFCRSSMLQINFYPFSLVIVWRLSPITQRNQILLPPIRAGTLIRFRLFRTSQRQRLTHLYTLCSLKGLVLILACLTHFVGADSPVNRHIAWSAVELLLFVWVFVYWGALGEIIWRIVLWLKLLLLITLQLLGKIVRGTSILQLLVLAYFVFQNRQIVCVV